MRVTFAGSVPEARLQVKEGVPPAATRSVSYGTPTVPCGRGLFVVIVSVAGLITSRSGTLSLCCGVLESTACATKSNVPAVVGTPLNCPVDEFRVTFGGNAPPDKMLQLTGVVPPIACNVKL